MNMEVYMYLVFDVGGTFVKYAWMTGDGTIEDRGKMPTKSRPGDTIDDFLASLGGVYDNYKAKGQVEGIAMGLPGQIDVENGIVYGGGGITYMHNVPLQRLLSERCDNVAVSLENDGKCAALAEVWLGNAKDCRDACVLVFGTGIGGGIIIDRKVHHGKRMIAGEVSFMYDNITRADLDKIVCVDGKNVDDILDIINLTWSTNAATSGLCYKVAVAKNMSPAEVTGEKIYQWAKAGDEVAIEVLEDVYFSIAKQCCNLYVTLDPDVILIGGGISAEPEFVKGINRYVEKLKKITHVYDGLRVDSCKFLNDSNLLGALYNFKQKYEPDTL
jgi:predicted NBD/HSP70 family sugar kinase